MGARGVTPWLEHRVLVTVGTGGVGKTTVSAALGLEAARQGRRVLVVTIDPARRLAEALGIRELGHRAHQISAERLRSLGIDGGGEFHAMMLDTKRTFDEVVARYSPDRESLERILNNPIYKNLSDALAGSREYSAMEKLHELHSSGAYDLIVLDTPPSGYALEFLDAPRRLTGFLESQFLRLLFRPALAWGRTGLRLFRFGSDTLLRVVERLTGLEFLRAISEFLLAFEGMLTGFTDRSREVEALLRDPICGFILVVGPASDQAQRAREFWARLDREGVHLTGLVVNRVHSWPAPGPPLPLDRRRAKRLGRWLTQALEANGGLADPDPKRSAQAVVETLARQAALASHDDAVCEELSEALGLDPIAVRRVPLFAEDVHTLEALAQLSPHLFPDAGHAGR